VCECTGKINLVFQQMYLKTGFRKFLQVRNTWCSEQSSTGHSDCYVRVAVAPSTTATRVPGNVLVPKLRYGQFSRSADVYRTRSKLLGRNGRATVRGNPSVLIPLLVLTLFTIRPHDACLRSLMFINRLTHPNATLRRVYD
jgi:hypothetical protein